MGASTIGQESVLFSCELKFKVTITQCKKVNVGLFVQTKNQEDPYLGIFVTWEHPRREHPQEKGINMPNLCRTYTNLFCLAFG